MGRQIVFYSVLTGRQLPNVENHCLSEPYLLFQQAMLYEILGKYLFFNNLYAMPLRQHIKSLSSYECTLVFQGFCAFDYPRSIKQSKPWIKGKHAFKRRKIMIFLYGKVITRVEIKEDYNLQSDKGRNSNRNYRLGKIRLG